MYVSIETASLSTYITSSLITEYFSVLIDLESISLLVVVTVIDGSPIASPTASVVIHVLFMRNPI